jgi:RNA polymerase-binding transcription factor
MTDGKDRPTPPPAMDRTALLERRRLLVDQVKRAEQDLHWFESNIEPELVEEGQEQALAGMLERLDEHDRAEIEAIDWALARIERGDYGVCTACGEAISPARLHALPAADLCLPCAERREAERRK